MTFSIPNLADAGFPAQAQVDKVDVDVLVAGHKGDYIVSGCAVTAQGSPDMTVAVAVGAIRVNGAVIVVSAGNVTVGAAHATNPRFDLITVNDSGTKACTAGTAAASPVFPAIPANSVVLAAVYVPANDTDIDANQIIDKRVIGTVSDAGLPPKTAAADTPDDHFNPGTIDGKWTVVSGSTGTVSLLETGNVSKYDLNSMPGFLLLQTGASQDQKVELRQDYTIPDGKSIVLCIYSAQCPSDGVNGQDNNEQWFGLAINDNDAGYDAGISNILFFDADTNSMGLAWYDFSSLTGCTGTDGADPGNAWAGSRLYLRIARSGLTYYGFFSNTGRAWMRVGGKTLGAAATNIWIFSHSKAAGGVPVPIHAIDFFLLGDNSILPWS